MMDNKDNMQDQQCLYDLQTLLARAHKREETNG